MISGRFLPRYFYESLFNSYGCFRLLAPVRIDQVQLFVRVVNSHILQVYRLDVPERSFRLRYDPSPMLRMIKAWKPNLLPWGPRWARKRIRRAHAVTWAFNLSSRFLFISEVSRRDSKRMLQIIFLKNRKTKVLLLNFMERVIYKSTQYYTVCIEFCTFYVSFFTHSSWFLYPRWLAKKPN